VFKTVGLSAAPNHLSAGRVQVKGNTLYVGIAAAAVVLILAVAFTVGFPFGASPGATTSTSPSFAETNSIQGANQTFLATYVSSIGTPTVPMTTSTTSTSTPTSTTSTSVTSTQSLVTGGSYTYNASSQVKVLSVAATVSGDGTVVFSVQFENIGNSTIYILGGGGSGLNASVPSGSSVSTQFDKARCMIVTTNVPVAPGQDYTATTPGCWSGYSFNLVAPGTVTVQLILSWSAGSSSPAPSGAVTITAEFELS
jgi:hypothetical protein